MRRNPFVLILFVVGLVAIFPCRAQTGNNERPKIIFDTDMGPDYDDVGAIATLHALAAKGECEILATMASDKHPTVAPTIDLFNRYFNRADIPVGKAHESAPNFIAENHWNDTLLAQFNSELLNNDYPDAVKLYREVLAEQEDKSVTIVTVGFMTNLSELLKSPPDAYSELNGMDLVKAKVNMWVTMAGRFPSGTEFNVRHDSLASYNAFKNWPTPILFSGVEIGAQIFTGSKVVKEGSTDNPVAAAYAYNFRTYLKEGETKRQSWDQTAVLCAVRNAEDYFYVNGPGEFVIQPNAYNKWDPDGQADHYFLSHKYPFQHIADIIDELMAFEPKGLKAVENSPFFKDQEPIYEKQRLDKGETMVAIAPNGNVMIKNRYSEDGGITWKPMVGKPETAFYYIVDEQSAHILAMVGPHKPTLPFYQWRSRDNGATWKRETVELQEDNNGWLASRSACDPGITLSEGKYRGRLLAASRVFVDYDNEKNYDYHYSNAIYSDDGGKTWIPSTPFPFSGTGEAGLVELSNGVIYYNSRCHTRIGNRLIAYSYDGGATWRDFRECDELPDGPPAFYGCKGGLVRLPVDGHDVLLFSMNDVPTNRDTSRHSTEGRQNLTVWVSFDGGKSWPVSRLVHKEGGYSGIAAGKSGTSSEGLLFLTCIDGSFSRFNMAWLLEGRSWSEFLQQ